MLSERKPRLLDRPRREVGSGDLRRSQEIGPRHPSRLGNFARVRHGLLIGKSYQDGTDLIFDHAVLFGPISEMRKNRCDVNAAYTELEPQPAEAAASSVFSLIIVCPQQEFDHTPGHVFLVNARCRSSSSPFELNRNNENAPVKLCIAVVSHRSFLQSRARCFRHRPARPSRRIYNMTVYTTRTSRRRRRIRSLPEPQARQKRPTRSKRT